MKPFSIKEHLEHPDWEVVTREGRPVRILCTDLDDNDYPVAAVVGNFHVDKYTAEGLFQAGKETKYDLFFAPEKHEGWVNIYEAAVPRQTIGCLVTRYAGSCIWPTEEEAKAAADPDPVATIKIEWEE